MECSSDESIKIWNIEDGELLNTIISSDELNSVAVSRDGNKISIPGLKYFNVVLLYYQNFILDQNELY